MLENNNNKLFYKLVMIGLCIFHPILHAQGHTICLSTCITMDQPAKRVIALNWSSTEMLLTLGVTPVGAAETKSYKKWQTNHPALPSKGIVDVGRRQEPHLASIAKLKPDLIIGYDFRHARIAHKLQQIAPTLIYQQFPTANQHDFRYFDQSIKVFNAIAQATGKQTEANELIRAMHQELSQLKSSLKNPNRRVVYAKFIGMGYGLRVFARSSLAGSILEKLGINYAWDQTLPGKDFTHFQIEQLPQLKNYHLLLAGDQTKNQRMTRSPVWQALPSVRQSHIYSVPPLWSFGGPTSITRMAREFTHALNNNNIE